MGSSYNKLKTVGIIAEYDPFHNGHLYHLNKAKEMTGAEAAAVVMSGHFMQRGMPSFFDRDLRVRMAIEAGADIVFELPYIYACGSSHDFALGGTGILNGLGCIDSLVFGGETDDMDLLKLAASASADREGILSPHIKKLLASGLSYAQAMTGAVEAVYGKEAADTLRSPNNLLGIEYIKALEGLGSDIQPLAISRSKADHGERACEAGEKDITSGTAIRELFLQGGPELIKPFIPETSSEELMVYMGDCKEAAGCESGAAASYNRRKAKMFELLSYIILTSSPEELSEIAGVDEGIENRFADAVRRAEDLDSFIELIKTRRYTHARLRRMTMNILMNLKKSRMAEMRGIFYARVMGFSATGRTLLRQISETADIPVFSNLGRLSLKDERVVTCLQYDMRAGDLFSMLSGKVDDKNREISYIPYRKG